MTTDVSVCSILKGIYDNGLYYKNLSALTYRLAILSDLYYYILVGTLDRVSPYNVKNAIMKECSSD